MSLVKIGFGLYDSCDVDIQEDVLNYYYLDLFGVVELELNKKQALALYERLKEEFDDSRRKNSCA